MKNLNLENFGVQEMDAREMAGIDGGKLPYAKYTWSATDNPLVYTVEAAVNGGKLLYNGVASVWNWATS